MQRAIKFRVWDKDAKKFYQPGYMYPALTLAGSIFDRQDGEEQDMTAQLVLMQFTGLHDAKGVEVYEGDVVAVPNWKYEPDNGEAPRELMEVKFVDGCFAIRGRRFELDEPLKETDPTDIEVIGNIWGNPELLHDSK